MGEVVPPIPEPGDWRERLILVVARQIGIEGPSDGWDNSDLRRVAAAVIDGLRIEPYGPVLGVFVIGAGE